MDASLRTPSTRSAAVTGLVLLATPIVVFGAAIYWNLKAGTDALGWPALVLMYVLGTLPGVVVGARYLETAKTKIAFAIAYLLVCTGVLFIESVTIGCWVTNVCL